MQDKPSYAKIVYQIVEEAKLNRELINNRKAQQKTERETLRNPDTIYYRERYQALQRYIEESNKELESTILGLRNILEHSLTTNNTILFDNFRIHEDFRKFEAPEELQIVEKASKDIFLSIVPRPTLINKLIPGWKRRYKNAIQAAEKDYQDYEKKYEKRFDAIVNITAQGSERE